jgi:hypothetical protein
MNSRARLEALRDDLSEDRLRKLIDLARFLASEDERKEWQHSGQTHLAWADEPDYGMLDDCEELPRLTSGLFVRPKRVTLPMPGVPVMPTDEE